MITLTTISMALVGLMISLLLKLSRLKQSTKKFSMRYWMKDNALQSIATILMVFVLLYFAPTMATGLLQVHVHDDSQFYDIFALCAGYSNHAMFHDFMKINKK